MKTVCYLTVCAALLSAETGLAAPLPILNILEMQSTSLAKISATTPTGETKEISSMVTTTEASLPKKITQEQSNNQATFASTVELYLNDPQNDYSGSVRAGVLFWSDGFTNGQHWSSFGGLTTDHTDITGEATAQLDMRFTITGNGAMIGVSTDRNTQTGLFTFSLFDVTGNHSLFHTTTNDTGFFSDDFFLTDGHTYQLHAISKIGPTPGQSMEGNFNWRISPLSITVPECSSLTLSSLGLLLFISSQHQAALSRLSSRKTRRRRENHG